MKLCREKPKNEQEREGIDRERKERKEMKGKERKERKGRVVEKQLRSKERKS